MSKRSYNGSEFDTKRQRFEVSHGQKRVRDDDAMEESTSKRQFTERDHMEFKMAQMRAENQRLRAAMDERDRIINYGSEEIRRLNADMFTLNQQMRIMHEYVANMEGRPLDMSVTAY
jgi:hypothetical protein